MTRQPVYCVDEDGLEGGIVVCECVVPEGDADDASLAILYESNARLRLLATVGGVLG